MKTERFENFSSGGARTEIYQNGRQKNANYVMTESSLHISMQVVDLMFLELKDVQEEDLDEPMQSYILCYDNI